MAVVHPPSVALTGALSHASTRRRLGQVLVGLASWLGLAALWVWQLEVYVPANWFNGVELILAMLAGWTCLSIAWVWWCRDIYRRRHRRTTPLRREVDSQHDSLGRGVLLAPEIHAARGQILVSVTEHGVKRYDLAPPRPLGYVEADHGDAAVRRGRQAA
jgi:hypothetical protein